MTVAEILADYLTDVGARQETKPAEGSRFHCFQALACHRARALDALGVEGEAPAPATLTAFAVGDAYHGLIQAALAAHHGDAFAAEVLVDFRPDVDLTGHADGWLAASGEVIEIKTMAPYAFGLAVGQRGQPGAGPKVEHVVQAGLYATMLGGVSVRLVYVDKGSGRIAEWWLGMGEPFAGWPSVAAAVDAELGEIVTLGMDLDKGELPARYVPGFGRVATVPEPGSRDQPWQCRLCRHRDLCAGLPAAPVNVGAVLLAAG